MAGQGVVGLGGLARGTGRQLLAQAPYVNKMGYPSPGLMLGAGVDFLRARRPSTPEGVGGEAKLELVARLTTRAGIRCMQMKGQGEEDRAGALWGEAV